MRSRCSRWRRSTWRAARRCRASRRAAPRSPSRPTSSAACFKTGRLFGAACALGGLFGGLDRPGIEALERFGEQLGIAFQLADDLLDCDGDPEATGKALGVDLLDGTVTLPLLLAAQRDEHVAAALLDRERAQADVVGVLARVARTRRDRRRPPRRAGARRRGARDAGRAARPQRPAGARGYRAGSDNPRPLRDRWQARSHAHADRPRSREGPGGRATRLRRRRRTARERRPARRSASSPIRRGGCAEAATRSTSSTTSTSTTRTCAA